MRQIREVLRLKYECGLDRAAIAASVGISKGSVSDYLARPPRTGLTWAEVICVDDAEVERAVQTDRPQRAAGADADRLRLGASRAAQDGGDACSSLGRVPRCCGRARSGQRPLPVQPVLRSVRRVRAKWTCRCGRCTAPARRHSSTTREEARVVDAQTGEVHRGRALRDGARREQLHVRGGDAHAEARGLRGLDGARAGVLRRRAADPRARPASQRGHRPRSLRPGDQRRRTLELAQHYET